MKRRTLMIMGVIACLLIGVAMTIWVANVSPSTFPQDQHYVLIPIILFWLFIFREYPKVLLALKRDISNSKVCEIDGVAIIHNKPGFRVLFAPPQQLSVNGMSFDLNGYLMGNCYIGRQVTVRYLPISRLLLSVKLSGETLNKDDNPQLNDIELSILRLMAKGEPDKIIARSLDLEPATVRTYNTALYRKLKVKTRKQASQKASELGYLDVN